MRQFLISVGHPDHHYGPEWMPNTIRGPLLDSMSRAGSSSVVPIDIEEIYPDRANDTVDALGQAESFIAGFEDDELQEGVDDILEGLRAAIVREQVRPALLDALKELRSAAIGFRDDAYRREPHLRVGVEATNMLSAFLANAERIIAQAEGLSHD